MPDGATGSIAVESPEHSCAARVLWKRTVTGEIRLSDEDVRAASDPVVFLCRTLYTPEVIDRDLVLRGRGQLSTVSFQTRTDWRRSQ